MPTNLVYIFTFWASHLMSWVARVTLQQSLYGLCMLRKPVHPAGCKMLGMTC